MKDEAEIKFMLAAAIFIAHSFSNRYGMQTRIDESIEAANRFVEAAKDEWGDVE